MSLKKKFLFACLTVALAFVGLVVLALGSKLLNMNSEYETARVIKSVHLFVKENEGQWPRSWDDLDKKLDKSYSYINFQLDPKTASKEEVLSAIKPKSGVYYTYPHARRNLVNLYKDLQSFSLSPINDSP